MGKTADITPRKKARIEVYIKETALSQQEIANKVGVSQQTVSRLSRKLAFGLPVGSQRANKCRCKRKSNTRDDRKLIQMCKQNRKMTSKMLQKEIESSGVFLSARTVRRRLVDSGLHARRPRKKPKLTPVMIKKCCDWAKMHQHLSESDWNKVCFSDESMFHIIDDRTPYVRRH